MNNCLIKTFQEKINEKDQIFNLYHNKEGKNQWNIICSAMQWISIVVDSIAIPKIDCNNDNVKSLRVMNFITYIDVLWESIQQLHRVFVNSKSIPFKGEKKIFTNRLFDEDDNSYFKTIRACFAAHPVNLKVLSQNNGKEQRYASWSGNFDAGSFSVLLFSSEAEKETCVLNISFRELMAFAKERYDYLNEIIKRIEDLVHDNIDEWRKKIIRKSENTAEQVDILIQEQYDRFNNAYYKNKLEELKIIFSTVIHGERNCLVVETYRNALKSMVEEIYTNLQNMDVLDLKSDLDIDDSPTEDCRYIFSKLCSFMFRDDGELFPMSIEMFKSCSLKYIDVSNSSSFKELYVLMKANFYLVHSRSAD